MTELLAIGTFARMVRLTVKALRHYDAEGLLAPAYIDPQSGYRYYTVSQVPQATTIGLLRSLDLPVARVRELLTADAEGRAALLAAERERLASEVDRQRRALDTLDRLSREPAATTYDVRIGDRLPERLAALRGVVRADRIDRDTSSLCSRLAALVPLVKAPFVAVYPLDLADAMDVAVGVPTNPTEPALEQYDLPGGGWASTLHVGPYSALPLAYTALLGRVGELGHETTGPVTETYLADPQHTPADELVTALAVHLR
jgi:DNA-binding transcriptional MerR regulator